MEKISHHFQYQYSDCTIIADSQHAIRAAKEQFFEDWAFISQFTEANPQWTNSYSPVQSNSPAARHPLIQSMENSAEMASVGPMAAVAGALADRMAIRMLSDPNLPAAIAVVENGGEIFLQSSQEIVISLAVVSSSLKTKLGFRYPGDFAPLGVATSSATFGHAESLGQADAVCVFAPNASLADAAATKICNEVKGRNDRHAIDNGLEAFSTIPSLYGVFIVKNEIIAKKGILPQIIRIHDDRGDIIKKKQQNK